MHFIEIVSDEKKVVIAPGDSGVTPRAGEEPRPFGMMIFPGELPSAPPFSW
jgi:hypothetical protein